jgi:hypothetical protein
MFMTQKSRAETQQRDARLSCALNARPLMRGLPHRSQLIQILPCFRSPLAIKRLCGNHVGIGGVSKPKGF